MQLTTLSAFRFEDVASRFWAFRQMGTAQRELEAVAGVSWGRLLGSGAGAGFDLLPNLGVYAILATWDHADRARDAMREAELFSGFRERAAERWMVALEATHATGAWDGCSPFDPAGEDPEGPMAVLTRAKIRTGRLVPFWRSVPSISRATEGRFDLRFGLGIGEWPLSQLATFSVWDDAEAMRAFAYGGSHGETMRRARRDGWFREDLFARFRVLGSEGTWGGRDPLD